MPHDVHHSVARRTHGQWSLLAVVLLAATNVGCQTFYGGKVSVVPNALHGASRLSAPEPMAIDTCRLAFYDIVLYQHEDFGRERAIAAMLGGKPGRVDNLAISVTDFFIPTTEPLYRNMVDWNYLCYHVTGNVRHALGDDAPPATEAAPSENAGATATDDPGGGEVTLTTDPLATRDKDLR